MMTQQRPVLYPNAYLKYVGKEAAVADTDECIQLAIDYGAREDSGTRVARDTARGAAVGGAAGAIGVSVARNLIGYDSASDTSGGGNAVLAYLKRADVTAFQAFLRSKGLSTHVRWSRGGDVLAACGQLSGDAL